jgi:hypothetical protein
MYLIVSFRGEVVVKKKRGVGVGQGWWMRKRSNELML